MLRGPSGRPMRRMSPVIGHPSSGVVNATGSIVSRGCVGAMKWFMMTVTSASLHVGMRVPPMIKAVLSGDDTSEDDADADAVGAGTTVAITTRTATPIDIAIRVAI